MGSFGALFVLWPLVGGTPYPHGSCILDQVDRRSFGRIPLKQSSTDRARSAFGDVHTPEAKKINKPGNKTLNK